MPKRRLTIHACAYGVMLACSTQLQADASAWNGSYVAGGSCFCVGEQSRYIDSQIIPTPVGGQSVAQICKRLGDGPTLQKINGKFNHTVYRDVQCGNGPFPESMTIENKQCVGHRGVKGEDCSLRGPLWDLSDAYSREVKNSEDNSTYSAVTGGSRHIKPPVRQATNKKGKQQSAVNTSLAKKTRTRSDSKKIVQKSRKRVVPETREQIRARQLVHLAAARERARLAASAQSNTAEETVAGLRPDDTAATVTPEIISPAKTETSKNASVESVADTATTTAVTKDASATVAALKLPAELSVGFPDFDYVEVAPVTYNYGGAGMSVAASKSSHNRTRYVLEAAAADNYREVAIGIGTFFSPAGAERLTVMVRAGLEYGLFNFSNDSVKADVADSGAFARLATRVAVTRQFELQAGVSYSSFFEGDVIGYGSAFYHLTPKLDLTAKAEAGDNDLLGFGIRYHY